MRTRTLGATDEVRTYAVVFDAGDEVISGLRAFAAHRHLAAAHLTAIGGVRRAVVGWFDPAVRDYRRTELDEQLEVLALVGDITAPAPGDHEPAVHVHATLGAPDATTRGGHLFEAIVRPTLEAFVTTWPGSLARRSDPSTGLPLIDLEVDAEPGADPDHDPRGGIHGPDRS